MRWVCVWHALSRTRKNWRKCFTSCIKVVMKYLPEQQKRTGGERDDSEADKGEERGGGCTDVM